MHEHAGPGTGAVLLLEVAVLCAVWSVSLFAARRLIADWGRLHDRATPAAHAGMGLAMGSIMLAPTPARPVVVGAAAGFGLLAAAFCRRAVSGRRATSASASGARPSYQLATASMAAVMALMVLGAGRGSLVLLLALVGCLLCCAAVYGRAMLRSWRGDDRRGWAGAGTNLTLTASMLAMLTAP
jgi:hypothetical protein